MCESVWVVLGSTASFLWGRLSVNLGGEKLISAASGSRKEKLTQRIYSSCYSLHEGKWLPMFVNLHIVELF